MELLENYLNLATLPSRNGSPFRVVVTIPLEYLCTGLGIALTDVGVRISAGEVRRLSCKAGILPMVLDEGSPAPVAQPELPPELIREIARQQEDRWLDDSIPALGGHTPREAAQDPVLREDLIALLDDFEWTHRRENNPLAMDVDRLRRELGIAPG